MSDDLFGQLCFFTFVTVLTGSNGVRDKRVKLATIHCRRSECEDNVEQFKTHNPQLGRSICAEFSFRECL